MHKDLLKENMKSHDRSTYLTLIKIDIIIKEDSQIPTIHLSIVYLPTYLPSTYLSFIIYLFYCQRTWWLTSGPKSL